MIVLNPVYFFAPLITAPNHWIVSWMEIPGIPNELFHVPGSQTLPDFPTVLSWGGTNSGGLGRSAAPTTPTCTPLLVPYSLSNSPFSLLLLPPTAAAGPGGEFVVQQFKRNLAHPALKTVSGARLPCSDLPGVRRMLQPWAPMWNPAAVSACHSRALAASSACRWAESSADISRNLVLPERWKPRH